MDATGAVPKSRWADLDGPVHYVEYGGPTGAPMLVCVHGLGGSLVNWAALAPLLTPTCRVAALDLAGFGHTRGGHRSTAVHANQRLLDRFLHEVTGSPVILVGNSMGGLIAILQAHEHPGTVAGLVLVDPVLSLTGGSRPDPRVLATFAAYAVPAVGRAVLARRRSTMSAEESAHDLLALCTVDPSRIPTHVVDQHVRLAEQRRSYSDTDGELLSAARSLLFVIADRGKYAAMQRSIAAPVLLLHGDKDRLVPVASARAAARANPAWQYEEAADVGHVPQLEVPEWTAERILGWLAAQPGAAATAALARPPQMARP
ncbi:MAG: alpha/beta fold hydrolase [Candidatus Nanopelagicales bacterium]